MSPILPSIGTRMGSGWGKYLANAPYEDTKFGDSLSQQVRFRVVRSGATSIKDVRPDSAAARKLWKRPETRTFVQGVLDLANDITTPGGGPTPLRGFTFATDEAGYVANRAVHHFRDPTSPSRTAYEAGLAAARFHTVDTAAVRKGQWLHLDPARSAGILHMLERPDTKPSELPPYLRDSLGRGVKTLLHELNHVSSPRTAEATALDWLSEGTAETLARWPGRVKGAGPQLGMPVPARVGKWFDDEGKPYQEEVDAVRGLLRLSGIDPSRTKQFGAAEALLNGLPEREVVGVLAARIGDRHARGSAAEAKLARRVERLIMKEVAPDGSHADPKVVRDLAAELRRTAVGADRA